MASNITGNLTITREELTRFREAKERAEAEASKREAHWERWLGKVDIWSEGRDHEELAQFLAFASMALLESRRLVRHLVRENRSLAQAAGRAGLERDVYKDQIRDLVDRVCETHYGHSRGGLGRSQKYEESRRAVREAWKVHPKAGRGTKTNFITRQALEHGVSNRAVEGWLSDTPPRRRKR